MHGITTEHAAAVGVPESLALSLFLELWGRRTRIAHNEQFDARIIRIAQHRAGELEPELVVWKNGVAECRARAYEQAHGMAFRGSTDVQSASGAAALVYGVRHELQVSSWIPTSNLHYDARKPILFDALSL
ncbi:hypothetical protein [Achromobacter denitrificans]|uniref:hypothetical protein n=1 Tax=Achromobacter denitrificans TaxID=32002 RepID=UPI003CFEF57F